MSGLTLGFLVSGQGTLFESLATKCQKGEIDAQPALVISSNPKAPALERAERLHVPQVVVRGRDYECDSAFSNALLTPLRRHGVDLVCLAGYLELVPAEIVREFRNRMLNIHPALLPCFGGKGMYGRRVHQAVFDSGVRITGATVHIVDEEYDHGPIVLQRAVFVRPEDTVETLEQRVHAIEHDLYADAVRLFAENRVRVEGRRVHILNSPCS